MRFTPASLMPLFLLLFISIVESIVPNHPQWQQIDEVVQQSQRDSPDPSSHQHSIFARAPIMQDACRNETCWIQGQPDLYGFGTRVGIYLTWSASLIANNWLPEEYDGALDSNTVFLFALTVTVIFYASKQQLRALDVLILLQLCLGFIFTVMMVWGYRSSIYWRELADGVKRFGGMGTYIRLFILSAISGYNLWFWSAGYRGTSLTDCKMYRDCHHDLRVFVFGFIFDLQSVKPRAIYLALSAMLCFHYLCMLLVMFSGCLRRCGSPVPPASPSRPRPKGVWPTLREQRRYYTRFTEGEFKALNRAFLFCNLVALSFSVASVEMTIKLNSISDVGRDNIVSYGQLLPLSIGGLTLCKAILDWFKERVFKESGKSPGSSSGSGSRSDRNTSKRINPKSRKHQPFKAKDTPDRYDGLLDRVLAAWLPWLLYWRPSAPMEKINDNHNTSRAR